jgi:hypothetical protein
MPNEPKADWEKEARELVTGYFANWMPETDAENAEVVLAARLSAAHAAGARETEEKLGRAMAVVDDVIKINEDIGDCLLCPLEECEAPHDGTYLHSARCPLVEQGFIGRDASRVGGKETK